MLLTCRPNHIDGFLRNHHRGGVGVAADDAGHDRGIHHTQALHAFHAQLRVYWVMVGYAHTAGAYGVVDGVGFGADDGFDLRISDRAGGSGQLSATQLGQGGLLQDGAHLFEAAHHAGHVVAVGQKVRVNQGGGQGVAAGQLHAAPAFGLQQAHVARVAVAEGGSCGRGLPACR